MKQGTRIETVMGCRLTGVVTHRFFWKDSTDGTYKAPKAADIPCLWDDGTKGYMHPIHVRERTHG